MMKELFKAVFRILKAVLKSLKTELISWIKRK